LHAEFALFARLVSHLSLYTLLFLLALLVFYLIS
jgi:hypothetical protein